ncbi:uncharacterized protein LOC119732957 isoform X2 [Patiria miniata]|uniref:Uncharacterized protein n=1 Tax=Patiria miniata TaxID=46514 RepID=A0A914AET6_PATMI|nr:uncharacterized protein LOC119732957 isoform X2 [Patiria miniata]
MPGKRRAKRGGIRPREKMTTRKAKSSTVKSLEDEPRPGPTMRPKRPRRCKGEGISQQEEMAEPSAQETITEESSAPGPSKPSSRRGKRGGSKIGQQVSSQGGHWELAREIKKPKTLAHSDVAIRHNDILVLRRYKKGIEMFNPDDKQESPMKFSRYLGPRIQIAFDDIHNRLVVLNCHCEPAPEVKVFNSDNTLAYQFTAVPIGVHSPPSAGTVAIKKDGTILVSFFTPYLYNEHRPSDGKLLRTIPTNINPHRLAADSKGRVFISCGSHGSVEVTDGNGVTLFTITPRIDGQSGLGCLGVVSDSSGIYVGVSQWRWHASMKTGHIHHYDLDGRFLDCVDQGLYDPTRIAFTADGQMAVADQNSIRIYRKV